MIEHIDKEIDNDENHRAGYDTSHYNRVVPLDYPLHRESSDAVPPKNGFGNHCTVQIASEIEADYSDDPELSHFSGHGGYEYSAMVTLLKGLL